MRTVNTNTYSEQISEPAKLGGNCAGSVQCTKNVRDCWGSIEVPAAMTSGEDARVHSWFAAGMADSSSRAVPPPPLAADVGGGGPETG